VEIGREVKIVEVGPRDGLQAESDIVPTKVKIELIDRLTRAGFANIEAASFVSPRWVPQMADGPAVMAGISRNESTVYSALVPNLKGLEHALESQVDEIVVFGAASEAFSQRNINCSIEESVSRFLDVVRMAKARGLRVRGSISCCFGCPYQGDVPVNSVADMVRRFAELGCDEIDLADTIGVGTAKQVGRVVAAASREFPTTQIAGHFHDTYGQALANIVSAYDAGLRIFGCPFAKGATGNVATEDVLYLMRGMGVETGIDLDTVVDAASFISSAIARPSSSRAGRALLAKRTAA